MKRLLLVLVTASGTALLSACGGGEVVVLAEAGTGPGSEAEASAVPDLEVRLLPYDRDQVFDSLQSVYPEPEPEVPDRLVELQSQVAEANAEWQEADAAWKELRDRLRSIKSEMEPYEEQGEAGLASADYELLFRDFADLEPQVNRAERQVDATFERFASLQNEYVSRSEEIRHQIEVWEEAAFAEVGEVILAKLEELKLKEMADTTSPSGVARFRPKKGTWWVVARHDLPYHELYWNLPIDVESGDPIEVHLTPENAELRPKY